MDGHLPNQSGVPQRSVLAPTLFLLHINDLLSATTNPIHSYADDSTLHSNIQSSKPISMLELDDKRRSMHMSPSRDLQIILDWGTKNLVQFNASKTQSCSLLHKKSNNTHRISMNDTSLQNKESFDLVGVAFEHDLSWHKHVTSIAT